MPREEKGDCMKLLILHDKSGIDEKLDNDTLMQVQEIQAALTDLNYQVVARSVTEYLSEVEEHLEDVKPDLVINIVESFAFSDKHIGLVPAFLESRGVAFTGCGSKGFLLTSDKLITKKILQAHGVLTPGLLSTEESKKNLRWIVKSADFHASLGMDQESVVSTSKEAHQKIREKQIHYGGKWFAEAYIEGREINISLFSYNGEVQALPAAEIIFENFDPKRPKIVDYDAKWVEDSFAYIHTPRQFLDAKKEKDLIARLHAEAKKCWDCLELTGYARVDFRVDEDENLWVLEANANPCLSIYGGYIAASEQAGYTYESMLQLIMKEASYAERLEDSRACNIRA